MDLPDVKADQTNLDSINNDVNSQLAKNGEKIDQVNTESINDNVNFDLQQSDKTNSEIKPEKWFFADSINQTQKQQFVQTPEKYQAVDQRLADTLPIKWEKCMIPDYESRMKAQFKPKIDKFDNPYTEQSSLSALDKFKKRLHLQQFSDNELDKIFDCQSDPENVQKSDSTDVSSQVGEYTAPSYGNFEEDCDFEIYENINCKTGIKKSITEKHEFETMASMCNKNVDFCLEKIIPADKDRYRLSQKFQSLLLQQCIWLSSSHNQNRDAVKVVISQIEYNIKMRNCYPILPVNTNIFEILEITIDDAKLSLIEFVLNLDDDAFYENNKLSIYVLIYLVLNFIENWCADHNTLNLLNMTTSQLKVEKQICLDSNTAQQQSKYTTNSNLAPTNLKINDNTAQFDKISDNNKSIISKKCVDRKNEIIAEINHLDENFTLLESKNGCFIKHCGDWLKFV